MCLASGRQCSRAGLGRIDTGVVEMHQRVARVNVTGDQAKTTRLVGRVAEAVERLTVQVNGECVALCIHPQVVDVRFLLDER